MSSSSYDDEDYSLQSIEIPFDTPPQRAPGTAPRSPLKPSRGFCGLHAGKDEASVSNDGPQAPACLHQAWQCMTCDCLHVCESDASYAPLACGGETGRKEGGECKSTTFKLYAVKLSGVGEDVRAEVWPVAQEIVMRDGDVVDASDVRSPEVLEESEKARIDARMEEVFDAELDTDVACLEGSDDASDESTAQTDVGRDSNNGVPVDCGPGNKGKASWYEKGEAPDLDRHGVMLPEAVSHSDMTTVDDGDRAGQVVDQCCDNGLKDDGKRAGNDNYNHAKDELVEGTALTGDDPPDNSYGTPEDIWSENSADGFLSMPLKINPPLRVHGFLRRDTAKAILTRMDSVTGLLDLAAKEGNNNKSAAASNNDQRSALHVSPMRPDEGNARSALHLKLDDKGKTYAATSSPISPEDVAGSDASTGERHGAEYRICHQAERRPKWSGVIVPPGSAGSKRPSSNSGDREGDNSGDRADQSNPRDSSLLSSISPDHSNPETSNKRGSKKLWHKVTSIRGTGAKDQKYLVKHGKRVVFAAKRHASTEAGPSTSKRAFADKNSGNAETDVVATSAVTSTSVPRGDVGRQQCRRSDGRVRTLSSVEAILNSGSQSSAAASAPTIRDTHSDRSASIGVDEERRDSFVDNMAGLDSAGKEQAVQAQAEPRSNFASAVTVNDEWTRVIPKAALENAITWLRDLSRPVDSSVQHVPTRSSTLPRCIKLVAAGNGEEYVMQRVHTSEVKSRQQPPQHSHANLAVQMQELERKLLQTEKQLEVMTCILGPRVSADWGVVRSPTNESSEG